MNIKIGAGQVFVYTVDVGGTAAYIAWSAIVFTHLRVRAGLETRHPSRNLSFPRLWQYLDLQI
jgi:amino acid permease